MDWHGTLIRLLMSTCINALLTDLIYQLGVYIVLRCSVCIMKNLSWNGWLRVNINCTILPYNCIIYYCVQLLNTNMKWNPMCCFLIFSRTNMYSFRKLMKGKSLRKHRILQRLLWRKIHKLTSKFKSLCIPLEGQFRNDNYKYKHVSNIMAACTYIYKSSVLWKTRLQVTQNSNNCCNLV